MLSLGLDAAQHRIYLETLAKSHEVKVTVQILTNNHEVVSTVSDLLLDGQIDATAPKVNDYEIENARVLTLQLLDPAQTLGFDSSAPDDGSVYLDRMIRVVYSVRCPFGWVDVPVFTGPVIKVDRDSDVINVEAHGKEEFGNKAVAWNTKNYGKGTDKVSVLRDLLVRTGEVAKYMSTTASSENIAGPVVVQRNSKLWPIACTVAQSMNRTLIYDGRGVARLFTISTQPILGFRSGEGSLICGEVTVAYATDDLANAVIVRGGKPKGSKNAVSATAIAPSTHPLTPLKLGRNGFYRFFLYEEENSDIRTTAAALARANKVLSYRLLQQTETTFDSLPVPHLEPWDAVTVTTPKVSITTAVHSFTLPLRVDALMKVGYTKNVMKPRRIGRP